MDKRKDPSSVDIKSILLGMRKYRMGLIQTPDQLRFSYMAVLEGAKYIMGDSSVQVCTCTITSSVSHSDSTSARYEIESGCRYFKLNCN